MNRIPKPQEIYKHFKGNLYQIITLAENSETGESMVIYQALYGEFKVYARPLGMFISKVDKVKYPDVEQECRFELLQAGALYGIEGKNCEANEVIQKAADNEAIQERHKREGSASQESEKREGSASQESNKREDSASQERSKRDGSTPQESNKREGSASQVGNKTECSAIQEEPTLDPLVWEFLDADSHEKRLNILAALHHRITDDMITTMAVACDIEVPDGNLEERYSQLKNCLLMLDRFEIRRK